MKEYRKIMGKLSWLATETRLDITYTILKIAQKNSKVTIADLHSINKVIKKVQKQESVILQKWDKRRIFR